MKIEVVKPWGFCAGVRRAIKLVEQAFKRYDCIYCLGELIHNEMVVGSLKSKGLIVLADLDEIKLSSNSALVISSHGATPSVYDFLKKFKVDIIDATCPIVKKIQLLCKKFSSLGYQILIYGNKDHEEVKSLIGFCSGKAVIISDEEDLAKIPLDKNTILISQSTKDKHELLKINYSLHGLGLKEMNFYNTICHDIQTRQDKLNALAGRVDLVLILGSRKSANTYTLYSIAEKRQLNSFLVSNLNELPKNEIKSAEKIGLVTGASTPYNFLHTVLREIKNLSKRGEKDG